MHAMLSLLAGSGDFHAWQVTFESQVMADTDQAQDNDSQTLFQILDHQRERLGCSEAANAIRRAELEREIALTQVVMRAYVQLRRSSSSAEEAQAPPWRSRQVAEPATSSGHGMTDNDDWWRSNGWWYGGYSEQHPK